MLQLDLSDSLQDLMKLISEQLKLFYWSQPSKQSNKPDYLFPIYGNCFSYSILRPLKLLNYLLFVLENLVLISFHSF